MEGINCHLGLNMTTYIWHCQNILGVQNQTQ